MNYVAANKTEKPLWRRIVDFPVVAMAVSLIVCIAADAIAGVIGESLPIPAGSLRTIMKDGLVLVAVLLVYKLVITRLGEHPRDDLRGRRALPDLGMGLATGFCIMALTVVAAAVANVYHLIGKGDSSQLANELVAAAIMPAFTEELLFRGILFRWLEEFGGSWVALLLTSAFFGAAHLHNPNASYVAAFGIAIEAGVLLGAAYMLTRSLWFPMGIHASWNFTLGEIFDVPVSGMAEHGLLKATLSGPPLLSGNGFGLEASLFAMVIATTFGLYLLWFAIRRGELMPPPWVRRRTKVAPATT